MEKENNSLSSYEFSFEPKKISKGKTIQEMSLIQGQYQEYIVTKTGYLVTVLSGTGINLDLLNEYEQTDVFEEYNAFLMSNVAEVKDEIFQFLDMTVPVDFKPFILSWRKRYLEVKNDKAVNEVAKNLIASYVEHYEDQDSQSDMTTQEHYIVLREKIKHKDFKSLQLAESNLSEKAWVFKKALEDQFQHYDLIINILTGNQTRNVLHLFMNFNKE